MPKVQATRAVSVCKVGARLMVPISQALAAQLGWNRNDLVQPSVVDGYLVVQRITLPKAPQLRKQNDTETTAR